MTLDTLKNLQGYVHLTADVPAFHRPSSPPDRRAFPVIRKAKKDELGKFM